MADIKYYDVILRPVITEKSMNQMSEKKYTFLVHPDANKSMIKEAVEKMFSGTKVASVNTINNDGKKRTRGRVIGYTAKTKKAIVQLTADSADIEIFAGLFEGYTGVVQSISEDSKKVTVLVKKGRRDMPVELDAGMIKIKEN